MIKLPVKPWTPPIRDTRPKPPKPQTPETPAASGGAQSGGGSGSPAIPTVEELFRELMQQYMPETVEFTPLSEDVLRETIRNWIRPAYEQAIASRREQTGRINAELDADAWSRGMGNSTYLSDVKERQFRNESRDVDTLESSYASTLAGHLYDAMKAQQEKKIEVDEFNAEAINRAREKAMSDAQALYRAYLSASRTSGGSGVSGVSVTDAADPEAETRAEKPSLLRMLLSGMPDVQPKTDFRTAESILARMSSEERARLYNRADPAYRDLRNEFLQSFGNDGFRKLIEKYPA